jgi:hypothetical protein
MLCAFLFSKEVGEMKMDVRLLTGIFIGMLVGLHYHTALIGYLPLLLVPTLILVLKMIHR